MSDLMRLPSGLIAGGLLSEVFDYCKQVRCALPAVNVVGTNGVSAALQAAREASSPIIVQFSSGGAHFFAGKFLDDVGCRAAVAGAFAGAHRGAHVRVSDTLKPRRPVPQRARGGEPVVAFPMNHPPPKRPPSPLRNEPLTPPRPVQLRLWPNRDVQLHMSLRKANAGGLKSENATRRWPVA